MIVYLYKCVISHVAKSNMRRDLVFPLNALHAQVFLLFLIILIYEDHIRYSIYRYWSFNYNVFYMIFYMRDFFLEFIDIWNINQIFQNIIVLSDNMNQTFQFIAQVSDITQSWYWFIWVNGIWCFMFDWKFQHIIFTDGNIHTDSFYAFISAYNERLSFTT